MPEPYVAYPRYRNLPVASMDELLDMGDARAMAVKALVLSPVLGAAFLFAVRLSSGTQDFFVGLTFNVVCALVWLVCHAVATFRCAKAVDIVTAPHREWQWTAPFSGAAFFFLPGIGALAPLAVLSFSARYFRERGIRLRGLRPREDDLVAWWETHRQLGDDG